MRASRLVIVMALGGCASAPSSSAPAAVLTATGFRIVRDDSGSRPQACSAAAMPNGRTRDTFSAGSRYQSPGKPAPMPNACPVRAAGPATLARPATLSAPHP